MNPEALPAPVPGSFAAHLLLDRQAPGIEAEIDRLLGADPPEDIGLILAGWWAGAYRFALIGESEDDVFGSLIEEPDDLETAVLLDLARSASSKWSIHAAPEVQERITALLLSCADQVGGVQ